MLYDCVKKARKSYIVKIFDKTTKSIVKKLAFFSKSIVKKRRVKRLKIVLFKFDYGLTAHKGT